MSTPRRSCAFSMALASRRWVLSRESASLTCSFALARSRRRSISESCSSRATTRLSFMTIFSILPRFSSSMLVVFSITSFSSAMSPSSFFNPSSNLSSGARSGCRMPTTRQRVSRADFSYPAALMMRSPFRSLEAASTAESNWCSSTNARASLGRFSNDPTKAASIVLRVESTKPTSLRRAACSVSCS